MSSYEYEARIRNTKYEEIVLNINKVIKKYDESISELDKIKGVEACDKLKNQLIEKNKTLLTKIKKIREVENILLSRGRAKDREIARKKALKEAQK